MELANITRLDLQFEIDLRYVLLQLGKCGAQSLVCGVKDATHVLGVQFRYRLHQGDCVIIPERGERHPQRTIYASMTRGDYLCNTEPLRYFNAVQTCGAASQN